MPSVKGLIKRILCRVLGLLSRKHIRNVLQIFRVHEHGLLNVDEKVQIRLPHFSQLCPMCVLSYKIGEAPAPALAFLPVPQENSLHVLQITNRKLDLLVNGLCCLCKSHGIVTLGGARCLVLLARKQLQALHVVFLGGDQYNSIDLDSVLRRIRCVLTVLIVELVEVLDPRVFN